MRKRVNSAYTSHCLVRERVVGLGGRVARVGIQVGPELGLGLVGEFQENSETGWKGTPLVLPPTAKGEGFCLT